MLLEGWINRVVRLGNERLSRLVGYCYWLAHYYFAVLLLTGGLGLDVCVLGLHVCVLG